MMKISVSDLVCTLVLLTPPVTKAFPIGLPLYHKISKIAEHNTISHAPIQNHDDPTHEHHARKAKGIDFFWKSGITHENQARTTGGNDGFLAIGPKHENHGHEAYGPNGEILAYGDKVTMSACSASTCIPPTPKELPRMPKSKRDENQHGGLHGKIHPVIVKARDFLLNMFGTLVPDSSHHTKPRTMVAAPVPVKMSQPTGDSGSKEPQIKRDAQGRLHLGEPFDGHALMKQIEAAKAQTLAKEKKLQKKEESWVDQLLWTIWAGDGDGNQLG